MVWIAGIMDRVVYDSNSSSFCDVIVYTHTIVFISSICLLFMTQAVAIIVLCFVYNFLENKYGYHDCIYDDIYVDRKYASEEHLDRTGRAVY